MDEELKRILYRKMLSMLEEEAAKRKCCVGGNVEEGLEVGGPREFMDIVKGCRVTAVFFYSPTCPYCKAYTPIFLDVAGEYRGKAAFIRVNVARNPMIAAYYNVMGVPTTIIFVNGRPIGALHGLVDHETLASAIDYALEKAGCKPN
ncbi:MAG: thioredoxin family protein [Desulfurococcales archaeon]|nr:thioredoxin family protein [Desulfurococcales archaeon]